MQREGDVVEPHRRHGAGVGGRILLTHGGRPVQRAVERRVAEVADEVEASIVEAHADHRTAAVVEDHLRRCA